MVPVHAYLPGQICTGSKWRKSTLSFTTSSAPTVIDLTDKVTDKDNLTYNISKTLKSVSNESIATATLEGNTLTVIPKAIETTITRN